MPSARKKIKVEPGSELARLLEDIGVLPVILEKGTERYTVVKEEVTKRAPTPEEVARSQEGIRKTAGAWKGLIDADAFKAYIRERRRRSSRPPVTL
jgi:hypothetical protein